jgi:CMP/dCMP kinase
MALQNDVVMDGRDIGEQVLPDAEFKFFITASIEERARRRIQEMAEQGYAVDENEVRQDMENRDRMDQERDLGALKILPDSIVIDTSLLNIDEVSNRMLMIIGEM